MRSSVVLSFAVFLTVVCFIQAEKAAASVPAASNVIHVPKGCSKADNPVYRYCCVRESTTQATTKSASGKTTAKPRGSARTDAEIKQGQKEVQDQLKAEITGLPEGCWPKPRNRYCCE